MDWGQLNPFSWGAKDPNDFRTGFDPDATKLEHGDQLRGSMWDQFGQTTGRAAPQAGAAATYGGADPTQQAEFRQRQLALADRLAGVASGQQQGAGELGAQRGAQRGVAGQQALARMGRGANAAGAARAAATNTANIQQDAVGQMGMAALQDQSAANQALTGVLQGGRGGDLSVMGMDQQAGMFNAGQQNQTNLANLQAKLSTMGMNDSAALGWMSQLTGLDTAELQARLEQDRMRLQENMGLANMDTSGWGANLVNLAGQGLIGYATGRGGK
jgi:hypothetical protein